MKENNGINTLEIINKNISLRKKFLPMIIVFVIVGFLSSTIGFSVCFLSEPYNYYYLIGAIIGTILFLVGISLCLFRAILGTKNDQLCRQLNQEIIAKEKEDLREIK